jgi:pimeloyl-ACP methyl ester carboxylesterase
MKIGCEGFVLMRGFPVRFLAIVLGAALAASVALASPFEGAFARDLLLRTRSGARLLSRVLGVEAAAGDEALVAFRRRLEHRAYQALRRELETAFLELEAQAAARGATADLAFLDRAAAQRLESAFATYAVRRELILRGVPAPRAVGTPLPQVLELGSGRTRLVVVRYANAGGEPLVLSHGLNMSSRGWREVGRRLHSLGYDVWMPNWRGHGKGSHRSRVEGYRRGDYGFSRIASEDLPAVLRRVQEETGRKALLIGHSMGGMISRLAPAELIRGRIEIGSPREFRGVPALIRRVSRLTEPLATRFAMRLPAFGPDRAPTVPDGERGILEQLRLLFWDFADPVVGRLLPRGLVNFENVTEAEFFALREKTLSGVHTDIAGDFMRWVNRGLAREGEHVVFTDYRDGPVPVLVVAGELDLLVPQSSLLEAVRALPAGQPVWSARMLRTGHLDLVVGERAADRLTPLIDRFARDPWSLGPAGSHVEIPQ